MNIIFRGGILSGFRLESQKDYILELFNREKQ